MRLAYVVPNYRAITAPSIPTWFPPELSAASASANAIAQEQLYDALANRLGIDPSNSES